MMNNQTLECHLRTQLQADFVEIVDNSWQHAGHAAMKNIHHAEGTHLQIQVVSSQFESLSLLDRHRLVHATLKDAFAQQLHALELKTYTPSEWDTHQSARA